MDRAYVGVDVAKEGLAVHVARLGPAGGYSNDEVGFAALAERLGPLEEGGGQIQLVMEPTGGYEARLARFGIEHGWVVSMVKPARVREWAKGEGRRAKTDRQDARMLADYGADKHPPSWQPLPSEVSELESLIRRRADLAGMLQAERNRKGAASLQPELSPAVPESLEKISQVLEEELGRIEGRIEELVGRSRQIKAEARLLTGVPGIGKRTVLPVLVLLRRWELQAGREASAKGLVAKVGLDPQPYQSGTSVARRTTISRMGDRKLRGQMVMAGLGGVGGKGPLQDFYRAMVGRGKPTLVALVAAARKILTWAWAVFRTSSP